MYTATLYFFGDYRPLTMEDTALARILIRLNYATMDADLKSWASETMRKLAKEIAKGYTAATLEESSRGLSLRHGHRDTWLDTETMSLPRYPGIDYGV